jgi:23S rRNA (pseudouridine1915-N3)-methyltransferase
MEVVFVRVGKTDMDFVNNGEEVYLARLRHYFNGVRLVDVKQGAKSGKSTPQVVREMEAEAIQRILQSGDYIILLDERGETYSSIQFANQLQKWLNRGPRRLVFIVGGAFGFSEQIYQLANARLSLSKMTFSHQLIRVLFLEQLYRAATIIKGEQYHNE